VTLCEVCIASNHDGIVLDVHKHLKKHLDDQGIAYRLNDDGWLDIPSN